MMCQKNSEYINENSFTLCEVTNHLQVY